ncbi:MAG: beta-propeller domain-containing protein [Polyangiaceae bacterium]
MHRSRLSWLSFFPAVLAATGCSSADPERPPPLLRERVATLTQAQSCDDLESLLKADALAKMNAQIDSMSYWYSEAGGGWLNGEDAMGDDGAVGSSGTGGGEEPATDGGETPEHSETNTQVEGVDEADIVKTDGERIYVLQDQQLAVVDAFPAADLSLAGGIAIEGTPVEMFLTDGKVVVFSHVDGTPLYESAGLPPHDDFCGDYGGYEGCGYYPSFTKVTVLALDEAKTQAAVERELYFEGSYTSSRRVDGHVRLVLSGGGGAGLPLQYYPGGADYPESEDEWMGALEAMRIQNSAIIQAATLEDFIPHHFARAGAEVSQLPLSCTGYYVPTAGTTDWGMTEVHSFDLDAPQADPTSTSVFGWADTVYADEDSLYLAARGYRDMYAPYSLFDVPVSTTYTHLHKFDIGSDPAQAAYVASATVPGTVHNQFSLDEHDGVLRVTTTDQEASSTTWETVNHLFTLSESAGALVTIGAVTRLAPGETVQSARFIGDRGYIVTFRQMDPLFVVDLADPSAPAVVAELQIPGFSSYMHPLDDGHLLTVGSEGTDDGQITGLAVQIFDVSDAAHPLLTHKQVIPNASSEVAWNHKAFSFYEGLLAIPASGWSDDYSAYFSRLEVFAIDAEAGITPRGSVDHTPFFGDAPSNDYYCGSWDTEVRRSVFIEDAVYSISRGGVVASGVADLAPLASLAFELPEDFYGCGGYEGEGDF